MGLWGDGAESGDDSDSSSSGSSDNEPCWKECIQTCTRLTCIFRMMGMMQPWWLLWPRLHPVLGLELWCLLHPVLHLKLWWMLRLELQQFRECGTNPLTGSGVGRSGDRLVHGCGWKEGSSGWRQGKGKFFKPWPAPCTSYSCQDLHLGLMIACSAQICMHIQNQCSGSIVQPDADGEGMAKHVCYIRTCGWSSWSCRTEVFCEDGVEWESCQWPQT